MALRFQCPIYSYLDLIFMPGLTFVAMALISRGHRDTWPAMRTRRCKRTSATPTISSFPPMQDRCMHGPSGESSGRVHAVRIFIWVVHLLSTKSLNLLESLESLNGRTYYFKVHVLSPINRNPRFINQAGFQIYSASLPGNLRQDVSTRKTNILVSSTHSA
jgi:hypothetical protein